MRYNSFLKDHIINYLNYRVSLGHYEDTYRALKSIDDFLSTKYNNESYFSKEMFEEWIQIHKNWNDATLRKMIGQLSNFCFYIFNSGVDIYVPNKSFAPKVTKYHPCIIEDKIMLDIFKCIDNYKSPDFSPSYFYLVCPVLFRLLFLCGLRPNEPCDLLCDDIDLDTGKIYINNTKRHKSRQIYMKSDMLLLCKKYDELISAIVPGRKYFFIKKGNEKLNVSNVEYYWKVIKKKMNNNKLTKFRVYDFRHNFATRSILNFYKSNEDFYTYINLLSAYMGHDSFEYTYYYISLIPSNIIKEKNIDWSSINQCIPEVK